MTKNLNENITPVEARQLLEVVTPLAKGCVFTKLELMQIASICNKAINRELEDSEVRNE